MSPRFTPLIALLIAAAAHAQPVVPGAARLARADNPDPVAVGNVLLSELNCLACHSSPAASAAVGRRGAPDLRDVGRRVSPAWLRDFLLSPHTVRPGTTMPDLLRITDRGRDRDVEHLVHFLTSLGGPIQPATIPVDAALIEDGRKLYHTIGCVACHDAADKATSGGVPIEDMYRKTTVDRLAEFLRDPLKLRPGGRMPSLRLTEHESVAIAAYVLRKQYEPGAPGLMGDFKAIDEELIPIGRRMFINLGCADCHHLEGFVSKVYAPSFSRNDLSPRTGCLDYKLPRSLPFYNLTEDQIDALRAALASEVRDTWSEPRDPAHEATLTLARLDCLACHTRDTLGPTPARLTYFASTLPPEAPAESKLPPTLTAAGQRLPQQTLEDMLIHSRNFPRVFLLTRMPTYGEPNVAPLIPLLQRTDATPQP